MALTVIIIHLVTSITFFGIGLTDAQYDTSTTQSQNDLYKAAENRYNAHKTQQLYTLLQKVGSPLPAYTSITNRIQQDIIPSQDEEEEIREKLSKVPGGIGIFPPGIPCSMFIMDVMNEALRTADYLIAIPRLDEFIKTCAVLRKMINEEIYVYAITSAMRTRNDTASVQIPALEYILPNLFIPAPVLNEARRKVMMAENEDVPIFVDYLYETSSYPNKEDCMGFFREDIGVNRHHYSWHQYNPSTYPSKTTQLRDRKGELFLYMHRQSIARYNSDRLACGLDTVKPFGDFSIPIEEGYDPKLLSNISGNYYAAREPNTLVRNPIGGDSVTQLEIHGKNIENVIATGVLWMKNSNVSVPIPEPGGISVIAEITEPNQLSDYYNGNLYGFFHGDGHVIISRCNDPDNRNAPAGVMLNVPVSMRDPVFYRWHKHIDDLGSAYQAKLPTYTSVDLSIADVTITGVVIQADPYCGDNILTTFWQERLLSIQEGVDFGAKNPIYIRTMHLQHTNFAHKITVMNVATTDIKVTVRLFIAPKYFANDTEIPYEAQRTLFITLDVFSAIVAPGEQEIIRQSADSSVTIPTGSTFDQLSAPPAYDRKSYCGCGWPDYLHIPKGKTDAMKFVYFVMLTNGDDYNETFSDPYKCATAPNYCGIVDQQYPDKKSMGFPFDRPPDSTIQQITDYESLYPNIKITDINIVHDNSLYDVNGTLIRDMEAKI